jgi:hypothetical protein
MALAFVLSLALYAVSCAPTVFWGDSAELAIRAASLELSPIARGYPLHRFLTWAAGALLGSPALGANAVSALLGAVGVALAHEAGRRLSGSRAGGFASAATLALCPTYWLYAGVAEVYTLHAALLLALFLAATSCAASRRARIAFGFLLGFSFLHHRMTAFAVPGLAAIVLAGALRRPDARGLRGLVADVAVGLAPGLIPFAVLCVAASRAPPPGTDATFGWWFADVFLGGEENTRHLFGAGVRSFGGNVVYVLRWIVYCLPPPALVLAALGLRRLVAARRDEAWGYALLLPLLLLFPFRYDWTGDQFSFLIPVYVVAAPLVAVGVAAVAARWGRRAAAVAAVSTGAVPAAVALLLAFTPLGSRLFPGLDDEARRVLVLPVRMGHERPRTFALANLERVPQGALLHADWGDGQVYRYLQQVDHVREDVEVRIWYGARPDLGRRDVEFLSAMPGRKGGAPVVLRLGNRLEDLGGGLHRVRPGDGR